MVQDVVVGFLEVFMVVEVGDVVQKYESVHTVDRGLTNHTGEKCWDKCGKTAWANATTTGFGNDYWSYSSSVYS